MNFRPLGSNQTELVIGTKVILFSYKTPVACQDTETEWMYRTSKKWSVTTSRHINKWLDGCKAIEKPQEYFDNLISKAK
jgi:hypothetical protein